MSDKKSERWCWHIWLECQAFSNNCFSQQIPAFMHASKLIFWWAVKLVKLTMQTVASWDLGRNSAGYQGPICSCSVRLLNTLRQDKLLFQTNLAGWLAAVKMTSRNVGWAGQASIADWLALSQDHPAEHFNLVQFVTCHHTTTRHQATVLYSSTASSDPSPVVLRFFSCASYLHIYRQGCIGTIKHSQSDLCFLRALRSPSYSCLNHYKKTWLVETIHFCDWIPSSVLALFNLVD